MLFIRLVNEHLLSTYYVLAAEKTNMIRHGVNTQVSPNQQTDDVGLGVKCREETRRPWSLAEAPSCSRGGQGRLPGGVSAPLRLGGRERGRLRRRGSVLLTSGSAEPGAAARDPHVA